MLEIKSLSIKYIDQCLIRKLDAQIAPGEILTLMGASGSGKSTVLHWIIGALDPVFHAEGELILNANRIDQSPTELRRIGILFQDDLLFAHLSVGQNLAFALANDIKGRALRRQSIETHLTQIGLTGFYDRDPASLSGGQRARISVLRALLAKPQALLLDEPFAKLDAVLREQFRAFVFERVKQLAIPTLLVTHDMADIPAQGRVLKIEDFQYA
ncbi:ATP-binding cassette domain-containing protein [Iodobacter ciconiae]|uniref:ATP-binding cassette domain-containing protein n=1 Tax=Iodobacter ciconiae TaxID=2496266 RepID=A0A3S8ZRP9_9NEIS|nr:ATP-binding cassette domain-containing protein [Iodobacter ciconiae]AZN36180.1 ATP-binding cassette domain-containing protein [Iodobacter ciconiae]